MSTTEIVLISMTLPCKKSVHVAIDTVQFCYYSNKKCIALVAVGYYELLFSFVADGYYELLFSFVAIVTKSCMALVAVGYYELLFSFVAIVTKIALHWLQLVTTSCWSYSHRNT